MHAHTYTQYIYIFIYITFVFWSLHANRSNIVSDETIFYTNCNHPHFRHLSTAEKLHLLYIVRHRSVDVTLELAQDQLVDKVPILHVCELLRYQGKVMN